MSGRLLVLAVAEGKLALLGSGEEDLRALSYVNGTWKTSTPLAAFLTKGPTDKIAEEVIPCQGIVS